MEKLYIISTPYHLLISIVKTILDNRIGKDYIILYEKNFSATAINRASLLFKKIFRYSNMDILINLIRLKIETIKLPILSLFSNQKYGLDSYWYKEKDIYIFNDNSYFGCFLNTHKINYTLIEDSLDFYKVNPFVSNHHSKIYSFLGFHWKYLSKSELSKSIEVNETKNLWLKSNKITESSRNKMFSDLKEKDIEIIANIFDYQPIQFSSSNEKTLLLTQPLDESIMSHESKIKLYKLLVKKYAIGTLYIKVHPREKENYSKIFPDAIILGNNTIPFEVYQLKEKFNFNRAVTACSKVIDSISCADEKIFMGIDWTMNFK